MKNRSQQWVRYRYLERSTNSSPPVISIDSSTTLGTYDSVTSSAIIHGDFKTPKPHSYTVNTEYMLNGRSLDYQYLASNPTNWVRLDRHGQMSASDSSFRIVPPTPFDSNVYNATLDRVNDQLRGNLDLAIDAAEAGSTTRMIKGLSKATRYIKGFGPKRWANEWLEYQYGWKPLLSDIYGAAEESRRTVLSGLGRVQARHRTLVPVNYPKNIPGSKIFMSFPTFDPTWTKGQSEVGCKIGMAFTVNDGFDPARWASLNPISIAWELCPYSFVVDWFYDIGGYLRNLETALLYNTAFKEGYVSEWARLVAEYRCVGSLDGYSTGSYKHDYIWDVAYARRWCQFRRTVLSSYPFPRIPSFKADLGSSRLISAAALLGQFLKR